MTYSAPVISYGMLLWISWNEFFNNIFFVTAAALLQHGKELTHVIERFW